LQDSRFWELWQVGWARVHEAEEAQHLQEAVVLPVCWQLQELALNTRDLVKVRSLLLELAKTLCPEKTPLTVDRVKLTWAF
jgi:hypothetical protein